MQFHRVIEGLREAARVHPELQGTINHFLYDAAGALRPNLFVRNEYQLESAFLGNCTLTFASASPALIQFADAISRGVVPEVVLAGA